MTYIGRAQPRASPALGTWHGRSRSCVPPETLTGDGVAEDPSRPFLSSPGPLSVRRKSPRSPQGLIPTLLCYLSVQRGEPEGQAGENVNRLGRVGHPRLGTRTSATGSGIGGPGEPLQSPFQSQFPAELCAPLSATFGK